MELLNFVWTKQQTFGFILGFGIIFLIIGLWMIYDFHIKSGYSFRFTELPSYFPFFFILVGILLILIYFKFMKFYKWGSWSDLEIFPPT
jgi:hypothetical protein